MKLNARETLWIIVLCAIICISAVFSVPFFVELALRYNWFQ